MIAMSGANVPKGGVEFQSLPPQIQQQIVSQWQTTHRQQLLKAEVERLKAEIKPVVDQKALSSILWPVPAQAEKEKA